MKPWSSPKVIWLKHSIIIDMNTIGLILHSYGKWPIEIYGLWLFNMFYLLNIVIFHGYVNQMVSDMDKYGPTQLVMFSNDMFWTTFNNHQQSIFKSLYFKSPQPYPPDGSFWRTAKGNCSSLINVSCLKSSIEILVPCLTGVATGTWIKELYVNHRGPWEIRIN